MSVARLKSGRLPSVSLSWARHIDLVTSFRTPFGWWCSISRSICIVVAQIHCSCTTWSHNLTICSSCFT